MFTDRRAFRNKNRQMERVVKLKLKKIGNPKNLNDWAQVLGNPRMEAADIGSQQLGEMHGLVEAEVHMNQDSEGTYVPNDPTANRVVRDEKSLDSLSDSSEEFPDDVAALAF